MWNRFDNGNSTIGEDATQITSTNAKEGPSRTRWCFAAFLAPDSELGELAKIADSSTVSVCVLASNARASKAGSS